MSRVIGKMHLAEITIAYGMTETSPVSFQSSVDDPVPPRVSTIGRVHPLPALDAYRRPRRDR